jgi:hypothetical protein
MSEYIQVKQLTYSVELAKRWVNSSRLTVGTPKTSSRITAASDLSLTATCALQIVSVKAAAKDVQNLESEMDNNHIFCCGESIPVVIGAHLYLLLLQCDVSRVHCPSSVLPCSPGYAYRLLDRL